MAAALRAVLVKGYNEKNFGTADGTRPEGTQTSLVEGAQVQDLPSFRKGSGVFWDSRKGVTPGTLGSVC